MQYIDPYSVTCPNCQNNHEYALDGLLKLKAVCKSCGHDLSSIGQEMNDKLDSWSLFVLRVELILELEKKFEIHYSDEEIEQLITIGDVIVRTTSKVSGRYNREQIEQQVYETTAEVGGYRSSQLYSDMSLIDAFCRTPENGTD